MKAIFRFLLSFFLLAALLWVWFQNLPVRKQQFLLNLLKQVPDLPARYQV